MPKVARISDTCTGHDCFPPRASVEGSDNVFINSKGALRVGDAWGAHTCPTIPETHTGSQSGGSSSVFANGKALARVGDGVDCGSSVATGSDNVFAG